MKASSCALIALVLALILGGAYYFYSQKKNDQTKNGSTAQTETNNQNENGNESNDLPVLEPEKAELLAVSGDGHGVANRIFSDKQFIHTVTAQLPDLAEGKFYNGWLSQVIDGKESFVNTGKFKENGDDYYLEYHNSVDLTAYKHVIVSLEDNDQTLAPTTIVLEGDFK